jgi:hypothetical protein
MRARQMRRGALFSNPLQWGLSVYQRNSYCVAVTSASAPCQEEVRLLAHGSSEEGVMAERLAYWGCGGKVQCFAVAPTLLTLLGAGADPLHAGVRLETEW